MTGRAAVEIILSEKERFELEARVRRRKIARADAMRAEIVLLAADGLNNCAIAEPSNRIDGLLLLVSTTPSTFLLGCAVLATWS